MPGDSGSFIREMVVIFGSGMFRDALRWRVTGCGTRGGTCPMGGCLFLGIDQ